MTNRITVLALNNDNQWIVFYAGRDEAEAARVVKVIKTKAVFGGLWAKAVRAIRG
jgi:hypothetical protein